MNIFFNFFLCGIFFFVTSCKELRDARSKPKEIVKRDNFEVIDLSKLTPENVIKTKYKKLSFICESLIEVEVLNDGAIQRDKKETIILWDIVSNTVFAKVLTFNDKILNLSFIFNGVLNLKLDNKFNTQIIGFPGFEVTTYASDGSIATTIKSDGSKNAFTLNENETTKVIEALFDLNQNKTSNKLEMSCKLVSDVYPHYK